MGRVVVVVGDPGSGKTHLLGALVRDRRWSDRPATVHRCASHQGVGDGTATPAAALRRIGGNRRDRLCPRDELLGTLLHRTLDPCWAAAAHERALELLTRHGDEPDEQRRGYHLAHSPARIRVRQLPRIVDAADELAATDPPRRRRGSPP